MARRFLKPIIPSLQLERVIKNKILDYLYGNIFEPIIDILKEEDLYNNSIDIIKRAIERNQIRYRNGIFYGKFSAAISRELRKLGYKYDKKIKGFKGDFSSLPPDVLTSINSANNKIISSSRLILSSLATSAVNISRTLPGLYFDLEFLSVINNLESQFTANILSVIEVKADITEYIKRRIAETYSENLKLYVRNFAEEEIIELREVVQKNTFAGYRNETLKDVIKEKYQVTERKAKFLARQETSILSANYTRARYEEAGITKYKWSTSHDERVRPDHAVLNGKIFSYDDPPITNQKTGARNNPRIDWGCRCLGIPVWEDKVSQ